MSLWARVNVNADRVGLIEVQRDEHLDLTGDRAQVDAAVCSYTVRLDGREIGKVRHRYGDRAWRLLAKACDLTARDGGH